MRSSTQAILISLATLLTSCSGSSGFSGSNNKKEASTKQATKSSQTERESDAKEAPKDPDDQKDLGKETKTDEDKSETAKTESKAPDTAVTKGSFSAWTDPPRPAPAQNYWIHIEVRLPSNISSYQQSDLSGRVLGTDGYQRGIGRDSKGALDGNSPPPGVHIDIPADQFQFAGKTAKVSVWVPGAEVLVRDTINIKSDLLKESQTLEIVFQ